VLLDAAQSRGARILTDSDVVDVEAGSNELEGRQVVILKNGRRLDADVVVGADGVLDDSLDWSLALRLTTNE